LAGLGSGLAIFTIGEYFSDPRARGFQVSRIERDGVVQARGVEVRDGEQVSGVRVVLSYGTASIRGVVNVANGTLPGDARISVRMTRAGDQTSNIGLIRVDTRGHFIVENLAAGVYDVYATVVMPGSKPRPPIKQQISVSNSGITDLALTVDLGTTPNP
jgi:hypothetical protein